MKFFLFSTAAFLLLCSGCAAPQSTTIFGDPCEALTEKQFDYLIAFSRGAIKKNSAKYKITQEESNIVKNTPPRLQTEYRGNRYGTLFIIWDAPKRRIGMRFEGQLDIEMPSCALILGSTDGKHVGGIKPDKTRRGR